MLGFLTRCIMFIYFSDTLAVLSRSISKEHFMPLAPECAQLGLTLLSKASDPDLKRCM